MQICMHAMQYSEQEEVETRRMEGESVYDIVDDIRRIIYPRYKNNNNKKKKR